MSSNEKPSCKSLGYVRNPPRVVGKTVRSCYSITKPSPQACVTLTSATGVSTSDQIIFDNVEYDNVSMYDNSTGEFTVPSSGVYHLTAQINTGGFSTTTDILLSFDARVNGSSIVYQRNSVSNQTNSEQALNLSADLQLSAGDVLTFTVAANSAVTYTLDGNSPSKSVYATLRKV